MTAVLSFVLEKPSLPWDSQRLGVSFQNSADSQVSAGTPRFGSLGVRKQGFRYHT